MQDLFWTELFFNVVARGRQFYDWYFPEKTLPIYEEVQIGHIEIIYKKNLSHVVFMY